MKQWAPFDPAPLLITALFGENPITAQKALNILSTLRSKVVLGKLGVRAPTNSVRDSLSYVTKLVKRLFRGSLNTRIFLLDCTHGYFD